jgi:glycosyltransferase involved in cell wall biosynthesis
MTYLGEGRPLIVSVEPDSELAAFVRREKIGIAVSPNNPDALASAILYLTDNPDQLKNMSQRAMNASGKYFDERVILNQWSRLVKQTANRT